MLQLFLLLVANVLCDPALEQGVYQLKEADFYDFVHDNDPTLVLFCTPYSGHCKKLAPEFTQVVELLADTSVKLASVDASKERRLAKAQEIHGYPTLLLYHGGVDTIYEGGHDAQNIVRWLTTTLAGPLVLHTPEDLASYRADKDIAVVGVFKGLGQPQALLFKHVCKAEKVGCAITSSPELRAHLGLDSGIHLLLLSNGSTEVFDGNWEQQELHTFIDLGLTPLVIGLNNHTHHIVFRDDREALLFLFLDPNADDFHHILNCSHQAAHQVRGHIVVAWVNLSDPDAGEFLAHMNIDSHPSVVAYNFSSHLKYHLPSGLPSDLTFCQIVAITANNFLNGQLKPKLKSQSTPPDWDALPVKVLTSENFAAVALDSNKHVFVKFYAPWCEFSAEVAPLWTQLADHFAGRADMVIAKMDAWENELSAFRIESYPTLLFFPKGDSKPHTFAEFVTLETLVEFAEAMAI
eukprot:NODE_1516_length_1476_cov_33.757598_g1438_i0.p1 GENE.NODE_1516_length_1476_cov_33.757598_g1438_i0~~NODE_1516_length_1476_cov_33.757598_g1438_i0.p1  ORF type:complete len:464 (-),score=121.86 NODE_1516_length_1476_cov_33.757598_g1438_i0:35-1426(-)